jgi:hypothetical protein
MTDRLRPAILAAAFALLALVLPAAAQEKKGEKPDAAKQKDAVVANLKKADLPAAHVVETEHFLLATTIPKDRAKALGAVLEKVAPVARKGAQFEEKEEPWKGKLAVYYLPEGRDFKSFVRNAVMEQPDGVHYDLRSDNPILVDPVEVPGKATEADQFANAAALVAGAYLRAKAGTARPPEWLVGGFGRVTTMRAAGLNSRRYAAHREAARAAALGIRVKPAALSELWGEEKPANIDTVANSFAEYLAYGPGKDKFASLIAGFRPNENGDVPGAMQALEAAGWKDMPMLEAAWRRWVTTGK